ncbi:MAG: hypothetical protein AB4290_27205 [Spirulina sp.]
MNVVAKIGDIGIRAIASQKHYLHEQNSREIFPASLQLNAGELAKNL